MFIKNEACICFLLTLFNYCFHHGVTPEAWFKTIIKPIPKSNLRSQSPADYRGISLQSFVAKTFSRLLNSHLREWLECNDTLSDEQNGFRTDRCCQYHIFALTSTIENRMVKGENDHHLKWPFSGCFTVEILNQKKNAFHKAKKIVLNHCQQVDSGFVASDGYGYQQFLHYTFLYPSINTWRMTVSSNAHIFSWCAPHVIFVMHGLMNCLAFILQCCQSLYVCFFLFCFVLFEIHMYGRYTGTCSLYFQASSFPARLQPLPSGTTTLRALPTYTCTFRFHPGMSCRERDCAGSVWWRKESLQRKDAAGAAIGAIFSRKRSGASRWSVALPFGSWMEDRPSLIPKRSWRDRFWTAMRMVSPRMWTAVTMHGVLPRRLDWIISGWTKSPSVRT